jgi:hypothetical protein
MLHKLVIGALRAMAVMFSSTAFAQGTAAEAKAMLDKAAVAVKADKAMTLDTINKGEGGFLDRDLYVFCFNIGDGKAVAMSSFDYNAPAELFLAKPIKGSRTQYRRFASAAEAFDTQMRTAHARSLRRMA